MDKNMPTTPKAKLKVKKAPLTPDSRSTFNPNNPARFTTRHKSTTNVHDLSLNMSVSAVKKKFVGQRTSLAPTSLTNSFGSKKTESDNAETELGLLYDDYLQTLMMDVLLKKKAAEKEKQILNQLASINKEKDLGLEKLTKMKARGRDIRFLSAVQNNVDTLVTEIRSNFDELNNSTVNGDLEKLKIQLEPFDFLRCQGIELPTSPDEHQEFQKSLNQCSNSLQVVSDLLKEKGENLQKVKTELKESIETQKKIESLQKNLNSTMNSLQNIALKTASQSFSESMS